MSSVKSVSSTRIPGLATGMDTDQMIKDLLTGEQNKVDKAKQKEQITKWQQENYREIIKNVKGLYDKYFSATSPDFILSSKVFSTINVNSSNDNIVSAIGGAGASNINYQFEVEKLAEPPKMSSTKASNKNDKLSGLGLNKIKDPTDSSKEIPKEVSFKFKFGEDKESKVITINSDDTIESVIKKINDSTSGEVKATFSEMTGEFSIQSKNTGVNSKLTLVDVEKNDKGEFIEKSPASSSSLDFLGINGTEKQGSNAVVTIKDSTGKILKDKVEYEKNTFTIDDVTYTLKGTTNSGETVKLNSTTDTKQTVEKLQAFINDYNKMIDEIYKDITEKKNKDYQPLTEAQKEDMSDEEIEKWEKKAKEGILRNDRELRSFMEDIKKSIFEPIGDLGVRLSDIGIKSDDDYNKPGQLHLDVEKYTKALEENGDLVYKATTGAFEKIKDITYKYAGSSGSIFVKKAGMEKTSSAVNNLFSEQLKRQETQIKNLTRKMKEKESDLYKKFARLEANMNKLNSQMSYFMSNMGM